MISYMQYRSLRLYFYLLSLDLRRKGERRSKAKRKKTGMLERFNQSRKHAPRVRAFIDSRQSGQLLDHQGIQADTIYVESAEKVS